MSLHLPDLRDFFPHVQLRSYLATCRIAPMSALLNSALSQLVADLDTADAWDRFDATCDQLRQRLAALIGAHPGHIALLPDLSTAAYQAASVQRWRGKRRRVLLAGSDWPSIAHIWQAQQVRGCDVITVDTPDSPRALENFLSNLDERTAIVCAPLVTWREGLRLPIEQLATAAHQVGAKLFVDASHATGVLPVDVERLGCDYLVTTTSTYLLGLPGLAALYVRQPAGGPKPTLTGRYGRRHPASADAFALDWPPTARRFDLDSPGVAAVYTALAGVDAISQLRIEDIEAHVRALTQAAAARLTDRGVRLAVGDSAQRGAHLAIVVPQAAAVGRFLQAHHVITAPEAGLVRASFHAFHTQADMDRLCDALIAYQERPRMPQPLAPPR